MPQVTARPANAISMLASSKKRRLSNSGRHVVTLWGCRSSANGSKRKIRFQPRTISRGRSLGSAVPQLQKLDIPVQALSPDDCSTFLRELDRASRQTMEVTQDTSLCFQRFLNAGMMAAEELSEMKSLVEKLIDRRDWGLNPRVVFINATELGGGVAEMRLDTIALFLDLDFRAQWLVMDGADRFYKVTVHMHEGIQNPNYQPLEPHETEIFHLTTIANFLRLEQDHPLSDIDVLWIDDPQPLGLAPLVKMLYPDVLVVWRCHVHLDAEPSIRAFIKDLTMGNLHPVRDLLLINFLKSRGHAVDKASPVDIQVFHQEIFAKNLGISLDRAHIMPPCINPLSFKNMELNNSLIESTLVKYGIMPEPCPGYNPPVPPYILEVSRYDPYKGPLELITAFRSAVLKMTSEMSEMQREIRLVLVSSLPGDNPSGKRLAKILQEYVDSLDLDGFPEEQQAGKPHDLRKRIHLLMLDDKAPWERLVDQLQVLCKKAGLGPDRVAKIAKEVHEMVRLPMRDIIANLLQVGLLSEEIAGQLAVDRLPHGVDFHPEQKWSLLDALETRMAKHGLDPGGTITTHRRADGDSLTGKEINAIEVNALQSGALVTVQFSSKEGFGLTVSESLVKSVPGYEGSFIGTLVGGIRPQAEACECFKIEYPSAEVAESLQEYRSLPVLPSTQYFRSLSNRINSRSSVIRLVECIHAGAMMPKEERQRKSRAARQAVLKNFSTWVNVHNILKGMAKAAKVPARGGAGTAIQNLQKLNLHLKALSPSERDAFLESLDRGCRQIMEVKTATAITFQRFLNSGVMAKQELSDIQALVRKVGALRNWRKSPRIVFINATELGGGVAEMRLDTVALFRDLNFRAQWLVMDGADRFYKVTVHIHEGIQNPKYAPLQPDETEIFHLNTIANFLRLEHDHPLSDIDVLWIDDPQPLGMAPLVKLLYPKVLVAWRCHVHVDAEPSIRSFIQDLTMGRLHPERDHLLLSFLKSRGHNVAKTPPVDVQVFHQEVFAANMGVSLGNAHIMPPCINPLSFKNMELSDRLIRSTLVKYGIMPGPRAGCYSRVPPYILEVSRYDPYKGPLELITAFRNAVLNMPLELQREIRLVLVSSLPGDNPSGVRLARILQEFIDALDLDGFPEEQQAGKLHDLRKRIHLLMLDDKSPWERLLDRLQQVRKESGLSADRVQKIAKEVRELARWPIPDCVAKLQHMGLLTSDLAAHLAKEPLPNGVGFSPQQKLALLEVLETRRSERRADPGGTTVTLRTAERDAFTGKEINAFEVNALQSGALVTVQFSSKEGFGLTVSEALVKAVPGYEGTTVCTLVGGIRPQAEACECFKIEYPPAEVAESLQEYRALPDHPSSTYFQSLFSRISARSSVTKLLEYIQTGATLSASEREQYAAAGKKGVMSNFSTWVNVHNILRGIDMAATRAAGINLQEEAHL